SRPPTGCPTASASRGWTPPPCSSARRRRWPSSCSPSRPCSSGAWPCCTRPTCGGPPCSPSPASPRPSGWLPPVASTASSLRASGSGRPSCRCCCSPSWPRSRPVPPGPSRRRWRGHPARGGRGAACWPCSRRSTPGSGCWPSGRCWRMRERSEGPSGPATESPGADDLSQATATGGLDTTGSRASRVIGLLALGGALALALFGLVFSPADEIQEDAVRILYLHVPVAISMYGAVILLGVGSAMWLWKRTQAWDVLAAASAEVGVVFTVLTLVTGMLWGRPTWGAYWVWDARLTTTALLLILLAGYLALRRVFAAPTARARSAAFAGLVVVLDLPLIHFSVDWWRPLHQDATIATIDVKIEGLMLFTLFLGMVEGVLVLWWLLLHRFRVAWLEEEVD